jgi:hypothetical protein
MGIFRGKLAKIPALLEFCIEGIDFGLAIA